MKCRFCNHEVPTVFLDLINSPPSNSILTREELNEPEVFYPLKIYVCERCFLVQIDEYKKSNEIFNEKYAYFSSFSSSWLNHAKNYVEMIVKRFNLTENSFIIEIASNDGYLLQYVKEKEIPCLGIEPSANTAEVAKQKGISTIVDYFGENLAKKLEKQNIKADLIIGNNVLAHVPNLSDFIKGLKWILKDDGFITFEFPHLMQLIDNNQFDTIYHEHFSYFSFMTILKIFKEYDFEIFDVEEISTHGGSLRIYIKNLEDKSKKISKNVEDLLKKEISKGMDKINYYQNFQEKVNKIKDDFLNYLIAQKLANKKIIAYGAAAKGNTILNYCGLKTDIIEFVVDRSPYKQEKFLPGSHIPILEEKVIIDFKPDIVIILPWNLKEEIITQLEYIREWNGKFVIAIPKLKII